LSTIGQLVQQHFRQQASIFDHLYDAKDGTESPVQKILRPIMFARRDRAVELVRERQSPSVLDIGCGSGRVAENMLDAGAGRYVGVDFSEPMIDLSRQRLARFGDKVKLLTGDFIAAPVEGTFDVGVAVGFFDYIEDPTPFVRKVASLVDDVFVASFPRKDLLKGTARKIRYEVLHDCPIFDYTERELNFLFKAAGFARVSLRTWTTGYVMTAYKR